MGLFRKLLDYKKRILGLALLTLAVLVGPYLVSRWNASKVCLTVHVLPDASSTPDSSTPENEGYRVACYNIAHGRGLATSNWDGGTASERMARLDQIAQLLRTIDADVVVLNEVDFESSWSQGVNQAEYLADRAGYAYRLEQRNYDARLLIWTWRFGNAVLSKYPISDAQVIDFPAYASWEAVLAGKKRGSICSIQIRERTVRVVATHLSPRSESVRVESARMVSSVLEASAAPVIVAGDFNSTPRGFPHAAEDQSGRNALSWLTDDGPLLRRPVEPPASDGLTFHATKPYCLIDWILIPGDWRFVDYRVDLSEWSDHRPVVVDIAPIK